MLNPEQSTVVASSSPKVLTVSVLSSALKVGDKVSKSPVLDDDAAVFHRIRKIDMKTAVFEVDPNSPYEKSWKGRLSDYKPHHVYPGYWVPKGMGVHARTELKTSKVKQDYEVAVNWHGEVIKTTVAAVSSSQALTIASNKLSANKLRAFAQWHIYQYMVTHESRVTVTAKQRATQNATVN